MDTYPCTLTGSDAHTPQTVQPASHADRQTNRIKEDNIFLPVTTTTATTMAWLVNSTQHQYTNIHTFGIDR